MLKTETKKLSVDNFELGLGAGRRGLAFIGYSHHIKNQYNMRTANHMKGERQPQCTS